MIQEPKGATQGCHRLFPLWAAGLAALILLGAALRAVRLDGGLWYDEYVTLIEYVRLPLRDLVTTYSWSNNHPLYSLLAHGAVGLFGEAAWSLRLPAALFGVLTIPALYALGRVVAERREALGASALLALSYHHIWFSQNARGYTGLLFFTVVSSHLFLRGLRGPGGRGVWVLYGVAVALGAYTHLTMAFVAAAHAALWGARRARGPALRDKKPGAVLGVAVAGFFTAVLYAPIAPQVLRFFLEKKPADVVRDVATPGWAAAEALRVLQAGLGIGTVGIVLAGCLCLVGLRSYARSDREWAALAVLPALLGAAAVLLLRQPVRPRFFFGSAGFALILAVRGAFEAQSWLVSRAGTLVPKAVVRRAGAGLVLVGAALSAASLPSLYRFPKQDYEGASAYLEANRGQGEPVFTAGMAAIPYRRYFRKPWPQVKSAEELEAAVAGGGRAWFVYTFAPYLRLSVPGVLEVVERSFEVVAVFPGALSGGDVYVARSRAEGPVERR